MVIYNVPGRTVVSMSNDTILRLAEIPNIVGVKKPAAISAKHRIDQQRPEVLSFYPAMTLPACLSCCVAVMAW